MSVTANLAVSPRAAGARAAETASPPIASRAKKWLADAISLLACLIIGACTSNGIVVESVNDYGSPGPGGADLANSIANGDGFLSGMTGDGSWRRLARWTNNNVWETDFMDSAVTASGGDDWTFDPGAAIEVVIHHSSPIAHAPFQAIASYDVLTPVYAPGVNRIATWTQRHFGADGREIQLPPIGGRTPAFKDEPKTAPRR